MSNRDKGVAIGAIVAILIAVGAFNSSNIVPVRQSENPDSLCPSSFNIRTPFVLSFINDGSKGATICVRIDSNSTDLNFTKQDDCLYIQNDRNSNTFKFSVKEFTNSVNINVSIQISYNYTTMFSSLNKRVYQCLYEKNYISDTFTFRG